MTKKRSILMAVVAIFAFSGFGCSSGGNGDSGGTAPPGVNSVTPPRLSIPLGYEEPISTTFENLAQIDEACTTQSVRIVGWYFRNDPSAPAGKRYVSDTELHKSNPNYRADVSGAQCLGVAFSVGVNEKGRSNGIDIVFLVQSGGDWEVLEIFTFRGRNDWV